MNVKPIKTHKITQKDTDLFKILDKYVKKVPEGAVLVVTSKIVAITEGRVVPIKKVQVQDSGQARMTEGRILKQVQNDTEQKDKLIEQEAELFLPRSSSKYNVSLTITRGNLVASAGIDESNADGSYVLWPKDPQKTANEIREYLKKKWEIREIGVIITDSKTTPLRWGVTGMAIAYSGFNPLKNYIGTKDLFGRKFEFEQLSIIDSLASSAALVMGEGAEQTPMALITDMPFVEFIDRNPTKKELESLKISIDDDIYAPLLRSAKWLKGLK